MSYRVWVKSAGATEADVQRLLVRTDEVAEVHNTLRVGVPVRLGATDVEIVS